MIDISQDIHPLTDFKRNTADFIKQIRQKKRPVVLTINGKAELVVQDAQSYQRILERLDRLETVEAIRVGVAAAAAGQTRPARKALAELQDKLGIPR